MNRSFQYKKELRATLALAIPITAGHLSQMILGFVDTLMIGKVGVIPLAATAFANTLLNIVFIIGIGFITSVSVFVSHAYGAKNWTEAGNLLRHGLVIALGSGLLMFAFLWGCFPVLDLLGQPPEVVAGCKGYLWLMAASLPIVMVIVCFRNYSEAQDVPWPAFWAGLLAVFVNIFLNWILIYGNLGAPRMELQGAGLATWLARAFNLVLLIIWLRLDVRFHPTWPAKWLDTVSLGIISKMLRLGMPVGLQLLLEVGAFSGTTLLMGWLGIIEMAAHQIALTCAATAFMMPLGLSLAVAIRVGHAVGGQNPERARIIGNGAFALSAFMSAIFACIFIFGNNLLAGLFTSDTETLNMAASLLVIAGLFQFFDGGQVLAMGALRGCKDVRIPTWVVFTAYWILGIPVGSVMAFGFGWGAVGLWTGLALGLAFAAFGLLYRFERLTRTLSAPLTVDGHQ